MYVSIRDNISVKILIFKWDMEKKSMPHLEVISVIFRSGISKLDRSAREKGGDFKPLKVNPILSSTSIFLLCMPLIRHRAIWFPSRATGERRRNKSFSFVGLSMFLLFHQELYMLGSKCFRWKATRVGACLCSPPDAHSEGQIEARCSRCFQLRWHTKPLWHRVSGHCREHN